jgi:undecaprenyl-diphosphatase
LGRLLEMKGDAGSGFLKRTLSRVSALEPTLLLVTLLVVLGLWGFVDIAGGVQAGEAGAVDNTILLAFRTPEDLGKPVGPIWLESVARDVTALGGVALLTFFTLAVCGYLWLERKRAMLWSVVAAVASGLALSLGLKSVFHRPRPSIVPHLAEYSTASFPSGHSLMAAVVYLTLGILLATSLPRRRLKVYVLTIAIALTALVGVSRVFLGVHYPTDVLAGWAAGLTWALICWVVVHWLETRGRIPPADEVGRDR